MEGCPKSVMINFDLKEISSIEEDAFQKPLSKYIQDFYHEDPKLYATEIKQITQLRKSLTQIPRDKQGCDVLCKYYAQLHYLQSRFPMASGGVACVPFIWHDVYSGEPAIYNDVRYEQACLLFNLGGLYSQLGTNESRMNEESMKTSCTYFQTAAGIFSFLKENFALSEMPDMTDEIITLKITIMLGQSLECILEKSIRDDKNHVLIAGICIQVRDYFNQAIDFLNHSGTSEMGSYLRKSWTKHLKIKLLAYEALAYTYFSNDVCKNEKYGDQVGYLKHANDKINEASKLLKNQSQKVIEMVNFITDVVGNKFNSAAKDNNFIYHMAVPDVSSLDEIKAVNFVKPIPFKYDDVSISGPDIFQKLVPMRAHESSSLYSEQKADLLRKVTASMQEKDMQLSEYMSALKIEELIDPKEDALPEEMLAKNKFLKDNPDLILKVENNKEELAVIASKLDSVFGELTLKLQNEKFEVQNEREMPLELKSLFEELECVEDAHGKASKTNSELVKHFNDLKNLIQFLSGDPASILKSLPSQNVVDAPTDEPVVQRIREILGKVDKMKNQRLKLLSQLREELNKDDITAQLAVRDKGNNEAFFQDQLKKHDGKVGLINQNLAAQENIIQALTEANAKYATMRERTNDISLQFNMKVKSYIDGITLFLNIQERMRSGLDFYEQLEKNVTIFEAKVNAYCGKSEKSKPVKKSVAISNVPPARPTAAKPDIMNDNANHATYPVPFNNNMPLDSRRDSDWHLDGHFVPQSFNQGQRFSNQQYPLAAPPRSGVHPQATGQIYSNNPADTTLKVSPFGLGNPHMNRININADGRSSGSSQAVHQMNNSEQNSSNSYQHPSQQCMPLGSNLTQGMQVAPGLSSQIRPAISNSMQPHNDNSFISSKQSHRPNIQAPNPAGYRFSNPRYPSQGMKMPPNIQNPNMQNPLPANQNTNHQPLKSTIVIPQQNATPHQQRPSIQRLPQQQIPSGHIQQSYPQQLQPPPLQVRPTAHQAQQPQVNRLVSPHILQQQVQSQAIHKGQVNLYQQPQHQQQQQSQFPQHPYSSQRSHSASAPPSNSQPLVNHTPQSLSQQQLPLHSRMPLQTNNQHSSIIQSRFPSQPSNKQTVPPQVPGQLVQQPSSMPQFHLQGNNQSRVPISQSSLQITNQHQPSLQAQHQPQNLSQSCLPSAINEPTQYQPSNRQDRYTQQISMPQSMQHRLPNQHQLVHKFTPISGTEVMHQKHIMMQRPQHNDMHLQQSYGSAITAPNSHGYQRMDTRNRELMPLNEPLSNSNTLPLPILPEKATESHQVFYQSADRDPSLIFPRTLVGSVGSDMHQQIRNNVSNVQDRSEQINKQQVCTDNSILNATSRSHVSLQPVSSPSFYTQEQIQENQVPFETNQNFSSKSHLPANTERLSTSANQPRKDGLHNVNVNLNTGVPSAPPPLQNIDDTYNRSGISQHLDHQSRIIPPMPYSGPAITQSNVNNHSGLLFSAKPMMSPVHDPVVSNILGKGMEIAQFNFAQIHLQNMVLQQQQLISMLQSQQQQNHRHGEDSKIQELQQKIAEQQSLIAQIKDKQDKDHNSEIMEKGKKKEVELQVEFQTEGTGDAKGIGNSTSSTHKKEHNDKSTEKSAVVVTTISEGDITGKKDGCSLISLSDSISPSIQNGILDVKANASMEIIHDTEHNSNSNVETTTGDANVLPEVMDMGNQSANSSNSMSSSVASVNNEIIFNHPNASLNNNHAQFYEPKIDCKVNTDNHKHTVLPRDNTENLVSISDEEHISAEVQSDKNENFILPHSDSQESIAIEEVGNVIHADSDISATSIICKNLSEQVNSQESLNSNETSAIKDSSAVSKTETSHESSIAVSDSKITNETCDSFQIASKFPDEISNNSSLSHNIDGQVVQLDDMHKPDNRLSDIIDHRYFARQLGRTSFYVGGPESTIWLKYIQELDAAVLKLHTLCKSLCKPVDNSKADGFLRIWNDLANLEEMDVKNFNSLAGQSNISKNRYRDILPWDHTRVKLTTLENDYINANLIQNLTPFSPNYIATQGPIPQTFQDFWTMVWEQKARIIVMLTNEIEGTKLKCHHYWSRADSSMEFENLAVIFMDETTSSGWKIRNFTLVDKLSEDAMTVTQMQFTSWPDYGTPDSPYELLAFMEDIYQQHSTHDPLFKSPLILHCSAGVGRTGSFCCIYSAIREMRGQNGLIEIPGVVRKLRQYRPHMVQRKEQLIFCYQAVLCFAQNFTSTEMINISCEKPKNTINHSSMDRETEPCSNFGNRTESQCVKEDLTGTTVKKEETTAHSEDNTLTVDVDSRSSNQGNSQDSCKEDALTSDNNSTNAPNNTNFKISSGIFDSAKTTTEQADINPP